MPPLEPVRAYRVLGLAPGATQADVKAAYRDLAQVWHPDRFRETPRLAEKAARNLQRINDAYAVLEGYVPPPGAAPAPRLSRDSIAAILGLGDLRDSGVFKSPVVEWTRRVLMSPPEAHRRPGRRTLWWVAGLLAAAALAATMVLST